MFRPCHDMSVLNWHGGAPQKGTMQFFEKYHYFGEKIETVGRLITPRISGYPTTRLHSSSSFVSRKQHGTLPHIPRVLDICR